MNWPSQWNMQSVKRQVFSRPIHEQDNCSSVPTGSLLLVSRGTNAINRNYRERVDDVDTAWDRATWVRDRATLRYIAPCNWLLVRDACASMRLGDRSPTRFFPLTISTPAVPTCCCSKGPAPYWSNPPFLTFDIRTLWRSVLSVRASECQKLKMVG